MSEQLDVAIVGGGPAGLSAARAYREAGGEGSVAIFAAEPHRPYRRPPLTKEYLRDEASREDLPIEPGDWYREREVEWREAPVAELDSGARELRTEAGETAAWRACVLATGSRPKRLPVDGANLPGVQTMRVVEDSDRLASAGEPGAEIVVIGSGFIGCEAAASLAMRGARVTLVTDEEQPQEARLGREPGGRIARWLHDVGVRLELGSAVDGIASDGDALRVETGRDSFAPATVLMASGVEPRLELAEGAGIEIADEGAIATDERLATSAPDVYAVGDIACPLHPRAARRLRVEHWGEALNHGEVVGRNLAGDDAAWDVAPGFWSTIGERTIKYVAWGDGFDEPRLEEHDGGFTVWYGQEGTTVGVLTHERDEDYERGRELVEGGKPLP